MLGSKVRWSYHVAVECRGEESNSTVKIEINRTVSVVFGTSDAEIKISHCFEEKKRLWRVLPLKPGVMYILACFGNQDCYRSDCHHPILFSSSPPPPPQSSLHFVHASDVAKMGPHSKTGHPDRRHRYHSSGAVWESRWGSWAVRPNEPSGFRGRKLRHWSQLVPNMSTDIWGH